MYEASGNCGTNKPVIDSDSIGGKVSQAQLDADDEIHARVTARFADPDYGNTDIQIMPEL